MTPEILDRLSDRRSQQLGHGRWNGPTSIVTLPAVSQPGGSDTHQFHIVGDARSRAARNKG